MVILLTGATGFLGFRTLEKLIELSEVEMIIANGRTLKPTHTILHEKVRYVLGDLSDKNFVKELVKPVTHVIHAAALSSPWGNYDTFYKSNVESQINLINAVVNSNIQIFVYISTPSLYFNFKDRWNVKEMDPLPSSFVNAYSETKRRAEIELENTTIPYVILRPRALTGRGDTVIMPRLIKAFDDGKLKIMGNGKNIVDLTSVANVVDAILLSLNPKEKALNTIYNISNGEPVNLWDKIDLVLKKMGKVLPQKKIPYFVVNTVATIMEWKSILTNKKEPVLTKYGVGTLTKSLTMDISKAKDLLGYEPKMSTDQAIEEFTNWYAENEKN
ncbi:MAG: nucleoside-diphosphate-sugar epimerase [Lentimonas sp.]|jgi:nucleoside-diphosphate-sugar epimerase